MLAGAMNKKVCVLYLLTVVNDTRVADIFRSYVMLVKLKMSVNIRAVAPPWP
jgi:hypothetical protein